MKNNRVVIWDWNGTLLDDIQVCINSMNMLLQKRKMDLIDIDRYREIFSFPVMEYYAALGFDFTVEPFRDLAVEFVGNYNKESSTSRLYNGAIQMLEYFRSINNKQIIISAMEIDALICQIKENKVFHFFDDIIGLNHIHANSKIDNALQFIENYPDSNRIEFIYIGDTYHDFEVAEALKCKCILVNNGHQNLNRFSFDNDVSIVNGISEILEKSILGENDD